MPWQRSRHKCVYYPKSVVLNALRADPAHAMSFLSLLAHQVIELRHRIEIMKVRSAKERVMLYLDLNAGADGRKVDFRSQLQDIAGDQETQGLVLKPQQ